MDNTINELKPMNVHAIGRIQTEMRKLADSKGKLNLKEENDNLHIEITPKFLFTLLSTYHGYIETDRDITCYNTYGDVVLKVSKCNI